MITQTYVRFPAPIQLNLRTGSPMRFRAGAGNNIAVSVTREFAMLPLRITIDAPTRQIFAYLSPVPYAILIYGPDDFGQACADSMDDHAEWVLHVLGNDPAATLQALLDNETQPTLPTRVPREVELWQAKAVMSAQGMIEAVEAAIDAMPEPQRTDVGFAWAGNARLARRGPTVAALAPALGLTSDQVDAWFVAAAAKVV